MLNKVAIVLIMVLTIGILGSIAVSALYKPDIYDQWNTLQEFEEVSSLRKFLIENGWVSNKIELVELDYILVLVQQCSSEFFPKVPTSLVLAIISFESSFNKDLIGFSNDTGLMQVIPKYHQDRIEKYIYDENVDLTDPRLNVMVGMDYLQDLMVWADDDVCLALMGYNMGEPIARRLYFKGKTTSYVESVLKRAEKIQDFMERRE